MFSEHNLFFLPKKAYQKGRTFTEATQILVQEIFCRIWTFNDRWRRCFAQKSNAKYLQRRTGKSNDTSFFSRKCKILTEKYGKVQVNPREINLFYLSETRNRIEFDGEQFQIVDKNLTFTLEELAEDWSKNFTKCFVKTSFSRKSFAQYCLYWWECRNYVLVRNAKSFEKFGVEFPFWFPETLCCS